MSFKPEPPRSMPEELARLGLKLLQPDSPYRLIGDQLYQQYDEADSIDLYHPEAKPAVSPVLLSFATAFQYMEGLSDRGAAEAVRVRLDWKYALHLPLHYQGFDLSVLSEFRDGLIEHQAETRLFERLLEQLGDLGLIKRRGRQRSDSLAVPPKVRGPNRLELVVEALRLALRALLAEDPDWTPSTVPPTWEERYGERCTAAKLTQDARKRLMVEVGQDGQWLLKRLEEEATPAVLRQLPEVETFRMVRDQQFEVMEEKVVFRPPGPYDGASQIATPHDPEARYRKQANQAWFGDKLPVIETDDEGYPHLITDIAMTSGAETDMVALNSIQARLEARELLPGERLADSGYISGPSLARIQEWGVALIGRLPPVRPPRSRMPEDLTQEQFSIEWTPTRLSVPRGTDRRRASSIAAMVPSFVSRQQSAEAVQCVLAVVLDSVDVVSPSVSIMTSGKPHGRVKKRRLSKLSATSTVAVSKVVCWHLLAPTVRARNAISVKPEATRRRCSQARLPIRVGRPLGRPGNTRK